MAPPEASPRRQVYHQMPERGVVTAATVVAGQVDAVGERSHVWGVRWGPQADGHRLPAVQAGRLALCEAATIARVVVGQQPREDGLRAGQPGGDSGIARHADHDPAGDIWVAARHAAAGAVIRILAVLRYEARDQP